MPQFTSFSFGALQVIATSHKSLAIMRPYISGQIQKMLLWSYGSSGSFEPISAEVNRL
jgi:hypothetical protein